MKGTIPETCSEWNETDDEQHRLTTCKTWSDLNSNHGSDVNFNDIYSEDKETLDRIVAKICMIWETRFANGRMKKWLIVLSFKTEPKVAIFSNYLRWMKYV